MFRFVFLAWAIFDLGQSANIVTNAPFWGQKYTDYPMARTLLIDDAGDLLVVSRSAGTITAVYENEQNQVLQQLIVDGGALGLNHGVAFSDGYLYASSTPTVYRWPYTPGQRSQIRAEPEIVIDGMPILGHVTRTLIFDKEGSLYINVGSLGNADPNADTRSRIPRFTIDPAKFPIDYNDGEIFAYGVRNEVGLDFDLQGVLWGVENGADDLNRPDLGGDIHNTNPAEDLNKFDGPVGSFYGYPYCFASYDLAGYERGTQFVWPTFMEDGVHSDAWCRNSRNNRPPALAMPAHNAPVGLKFYRGEGCDTVPGSFPCSAIGDAFIAYHGSWNAEPASGYRVAWLPMNKTTNLPTGESFDIIYELNPSDCQGLCFRPVNAVFNNQGHLLISDDTTNAIYRVTYDMQPK